MKKNYTSPVVEVNVFDVADVVMTSDPTPNSLKQNGDGNAQTFKDNVTTGSIVVEW